MPLYASSGNRKQVALNILKTEQVFRFSTVTHTHTLTHTKRERKDGKLLFNRLYMDWSCNLSTP